MSDRLVYYDDCGSDEACLGRKIYHAALDDRRGFRPDQIGIPASDDVWLEIFEGIGKAALDRVRREARNEALEEAAELCVQMTGTPRYGRNIRAMMEEQKDE